MDAPRFVAWLLPASKCVFHITTFLCIDFDIRLATPAFLYYYCSSRTPSTVIRGPQACCLLDGYDEFLGLGLIPPALPLMAAFLLENRSSILGLLLLLLRLLLLLLPLLLLQGGLSQRRRQTTTHKIANHIPIDHDEPLI